MKVQLPTGREVHLFIKHDHLPDGRRFTEVTVRPTDDTFTGAFGVTATAICNPKDTFSRREGRRMAMRRLNDRMREAKYPVEERRAICARVFP